MRETKPIVHLIAEPRIHWGNIEQYLISVGGEPWFRRVMGIDEGSTLSDAELLVEFMARGCYRSWAPGLNANVTKVRTDSMEYLENVLKQAHGSVMEHANFSFMFQDVSRVATHELVRHRVGVAISQESLRYVRLTDLGFRIPEVLEPLRPQLVSIVETLEEFQRSAAEHFGLDDSGAPFHVKKEVTSALRRLAPIGLSTSIGWTANARTLRFVIQKRTEEAAEEEIRIIFDRVAALVVKNFPGLFGDFKRNEKGEWVTPYSKV